MIEQTCKNCPHRVDGENRNCPCWLSEKNGLLEINPETNEERFITGCFYEIVPKILIELINATNNNTSNIKSLHENTSTELNKLANVIIRLPELSALSQRIMENKEQESASKEKETK